MRRRRSCSVLLSLANAPEPARRCVVGEEVVGVAAGAWVRPISVREPEDVSEHERRYQDGSDPKLLDGIDDRGAGMEAAR